MTKVIYQKQETKNASEEAKMVKSVYKVYVILSLSFISPPVGTPAVGLMAWICPIVQACVIYRFGCFFLDTSNTIHPTYPLLLNSVVEY